MVPPGNSGTVDRLVCAPTRPTDPRPSHPKARPPASSAQTFLPLHGRPLRTRRQDSPPREYAAPQAGVMVAPMEPQNRFPTPPKLRITAKNCTKRQNAFPNPSPINALHAQNHVAKTPLKPPQNAISTPKTRHVTASRFSNAGRSISQTGTRFGPREQPASPHRWFCPEHTHLANFVPAPYRAGLPATARSTLSRIVTMRCVVLTRGVSARSDRLVPRHGERLLPTECLVLHKQAK